MKIVYQLISLTSPKFEYIFVLWVENCGDTKMWETISPLIYYQSISSYCTEGGHDCGRWTSEKLLQVEATQT